jgi:hypothetical protein
LHRENLLVVENRDHQTNLVSHLKYATDSLPQMAPGCIDQPAAAQISLALQTGRKLSKPAATNLHSQ